MNDLRKVLVVDDGERAAQHGLSAELAELGFASVTTSLDAADDVLAVIPQPAAILLHMPADRGHARYASFVAMADRLTSCRANDVPVLMVHPEQAGGSSALSAILRREFGPRVFASPAE